MTGNSAGKALNFAGIIANFAGKPPGLAGTVAEIVGASANFAGTVAGTAGDAASFAGAGADLAGTAAALAGRNTRDVTAPSGGKKESRPNWELSFEEKLLRADCFKRNCGTAELRNCGTAELRNCGTAELRNCGTKGRNLAMDLQKVNYPAMFSEPRSLGVMAKYFIRSACVKLFLKKVFGRSGSIAYPKRNPAIHTELIEINHVADSGAPPPSDKPFSRQRANSPKKAIPCGACDGYSSAACHFRITKTRGRQHSTE
jgi:hypothetical protein